MRAAPEEREIELLEEKKFYLSWQCVLTAQKASPAFGCSKRSMASQLKEMIVPLFAAAETPLGVLHPGLGRLNKRRTQIH